MSIKSIKVKAMIRRLLKDKFYLLAILILFSLSCLALNPLLGIPTPEILAPENKEDTIVFSSLSSDGVYVYVVQIGKEIVVNKFEQKVSYIDGISLSPDENRISFSSENNIFIVNIDGSNISQAVNSGYAPVWSADGRYILFDAQFINSDGLSTYTVSAIDTTNLKIYTCPLLGEGFNANNIQWVPNSHEVIYAVSDWYDSGDLYQCDILTGEGKYILKTEYIVEDKVFLSSDGRKLVYVEVNVGTLEEPYEVFKLADLTLEGVVNSKPFLEIYIDKPVQKEMPFTGVCCLSWSPDDNYIAMLATTDGSLPLDVYVFDKFGNFYKQITNTPEWAEGVPVWLSNSNSLVFSKDPFATGKALYQVVVVDIDTGNERIIVSEPEVLFGEISK